MSFEEDHNTAHDILGITVVEADKSVEFKYVDIEFSKKQIKEYYNYAKENDIFDDPVRNIHLPKISAEIKEPSFGDLVAGQTAFCMGQEYGKIMQNIYTKKAFHCRI